MPVEQQPQQNTADLFRSLCYRAFINTAMHRDLRELAFKMVPGLNSFEATVVGHYSFLVCGPGYEAFVRTAHGADANTLVQLQYKGSGASDTRIINPSHTTNREMLQDIFTRIRKLAEADRIRAIAECK